MFLPVSHIKCYRFPILNATFTTVAFTLRIFVFLETVGYEYKYHLLHIIPVPALILKSNPLRQTAHESNLSLKLPFTR